jgi:hypothetical protein
LNPSMDLHHFQSMQFVMNEIKVCCFFPNWLLCL